MQGRALSHTRWKCTEPAPRVAALKVHFHSSHFHGVTLAKKGERWGKAGLASLRRRLFSTSLWIQRSRACKGQQPLLIFTKAATTKASWGKGSVPVESHLHSGYHSTMKLFQTAHRLSSGFHPNSTVPAELCLQRHIKQRHSDDI